MYFCSRLKVQVNWIVTEKQVKEKQNKCAVAFFPSFFFYYFHKCFNTFESNVQ